MTDGCGNLLNDSRWVVGFRVDVEQFVVRFSVWLEETVCQVECDMEVILG